MQNKGFTLLEMLTVVMIVGILTAVAIPQYKNVATKARVVEAQSLLRTIYDTSERLAGEFGYRSYEKLLDDKGWANEKDYSFARTDMFGSISTTLPSGCTLADHGTLLKCARFHYKISVKSNNNRYYAVARKVTAPYANTYILLDRGNMSLLCQPDRSVDPQGEACDLFGMNMIDAGISIE